MLIALAVLRVTMAVPADASWLKPAPFVLDASILVEQSAFVMASSVRDACIGGLMKPINPNEQIDLKARKKDEHLGLTFASWKYSGLNNF